MVPSLRKLSEPSFLSAESLKEIKAVNGRNRYNYSASVKLLKTSTMNRGQDENDVSIKPLEEATQDYSSPAPVKPLEEINNESVHHHGQDDNDDPTKPLEETSTKTLAPEAQDDSSPSMMLSALQARLAWDPRTCSDMYSLYFFTMNEQTCNVTYEPLIRNIPLDYHATSWSEPLANLATESCLAMKQVPEENVHERAFSARQMLAIVTDVNVYSLGNYTVSSHLPKCLLAVSGARSFPYKQLLVTPYEARGYDEQRVEDRVPFHERSPMLVFRGSTPCDPSGYRRQVVALAANHSIMNGTQWLDARCSDDDRIPFQVMCDKYKYHLNIGGVSGTTWSALHWKMNCGGLVFSVEMPNGNKDWWHQYLQPFEHYIPVEPTLESLRYWYDWAEQHPKEAQAIAQAGQNVSRHTEKVRVKQEHMWNAFHSCEPSMQEYRQLREFCEEHA